MVHHPALLCNGYNVIGEDHSELIASLKRWSIPEALALVKVPRRWCSSGPRGSDGCGSAGASDCCVGACGAGAQLQGPQLHGTGGGGWGV